jgi:hypothetical protein
MSLRSRLALAGVGITLVTSPTVAHAAPRVAGAGCPTDRLCLYSGTDYTGTRTDVAVPAKPYPCQNAPFNSVVNNTMLAVNKYFVSGCSGRKVTLRGGDRFGGAAGETYNSYQFAG